jgi:PIN domain nuclease of toxin-antitoxin system
MRLTCHQAICNVEASARTHTELPIISDHVVATEGLPPIHKDPFDRVIVAQATVEGVTLLTIDSLVSQYPGPIKTV